MILILLQAARTQPANMMMLQAGIPVLVLHLTNPDNIVLLQAPNTTQFLGTPWPADSPSLDSCTLSTLYKSC
jgi:hypothetical protein